MIIGVAVVGHGRWGGVHVRNLLAMERCRLLWVCDPSPEALAQLPSGHAPCCGTSELDRVLEDAAVQAVVIASPAPTHEALAAACLEAGKHVLVEKPMCDSLAAARRLEEVAARTNRRLHVGHLCVHHPGVRRVQRLLAEGGAGRLLAVDAVRTSVPPQQPGVSVLWDLGVHDLSIIHTWIGRAPERAAAVGASPASGMPEDEVHATLLYPEGVLARMRVSWRGPVKVRRCVATGTDAVVTFDDLAPSAPVLVDTGAGGEPLDDLEAGQPLRRELEHFLDAVSAPIPSPNDGAAGVEVLRTLAALERSLRSGGGLVEVA